MSDFQTPCPSCGAPVIFRIGSSIVTVCEFCKSVVARGDRKIEDLGKVADLVDTGSPLDVGLRGVYHGVPFELTGRAQLGHEAGGVWDEWYAAFGDGRWGWLAEAQGKFYLTFQHQLSEQALVPPLETLVLGQPVPAVSSTVSLIVAETGEAEALGAKGEIPYKLVPGETYYYADLSGPHGEFATLDYSEEQPMLFIGREVTLQDLGVADAKTPEREARRVAGLQLSCPQCAGPLELRAPDKSERVTCPNCGSLLNINGNKLEFLRVLDLKVRPIIPLGAVGELNGTTFMVIGFVLRSVVIDKKYFWEEYLLYEPRTGFRWLVRSDDHWNFVQTVSPGEVTSIGNSATYNGLRFRLFQDAAANVENVQGEFYWKVEVGESVAARDFVHPPYMLSLEASAAAGATARRQKKGKQSARAVQTGEINWSFGTYIERSKIEKAFGVSGLPAPSTVAPNQLFPHKRVYKYWGIFLAAIILLGIILGVTAPRKKIFEQAFQLQPLKASDSTTPIFTDPIELRGGRNIRVSAQAPVDNAWLYLDGDFINEDTGLVQQFSLPVEYYHGVDDGESWSEGSNNPDVFLSAVPSGKYTLRLEASWQNWAQPTAVTVRVEQGVPRLLNLFLAILVVSVIPVFTLIRHIGFEKRRWQDSNVTTSSSYSSASGSSDND